MRVIGILGGYGCLGLSFLIVFEIFARKLFNYSLQGVDEIGGYVVAITGTFGMALAAVERAHTRIDVLLLRLPRRMQTVLNLVSYVALGMGAAFMGYMGWRTLDESLTFGSVSSSPLQVPLWIPQSLWMAGLVVFGLSAVWTALRGVMALRHGLDAADRVLAPPTVAEEIEEARR
ncbi:TRAP transporter small permease subunit [Roseobacter sp.]|uniref:TRAP transporter small permease subunit n=1 Tax=Roseobacter sp. TaxID=1907202 RepID=UPI003857F9AE